MPTKSTYHAWVPNVSGAISFSNIKGAAIPGRAKQPKTLNLLGNQIDPIIKSLQERNLSDRPHAIMLNRGRFYFLLSASLSSLENYGSEDEKLIGNIYIMPKVEISDSELIKINNFSAVEDANFLENTWKHKEEVAQISFEMRRDGRVCLTYNGVTHCEYSYNLVFEAFSFLKDLIHCHKFHRRDDDAIVVPYTDDYTRNFEWMDKTIRNIHKSIVSAYRNAQYQIDIRNAIGKLSYLESIQRLAQKHRGGGGICINTVALRDSLEVRLATIFEQENKKSMLMQIVISLFVSVFSTVIAMIQLLQVPCIENLSASIECHKMNKNLPFVLQDGAIGVVQYFLLNWKNCLFFFPALLLATYVISNIKQVLKRINDYWGAGLFGTFLRMVFSFAMSTKPRSAALTVILSILPFLVMYLFYSLFTWLMH